MLQKNSFSGLLANARKCHLLTSSILPVDTHITNTKISNVERVKLLGVNTEDLLKRNKSLSFGQKNLQLLATEIYKTKNDLVSKIMKDTFHFIQKPYNLRNDPELQRRRNRTVYFGTESISSLAPKIWELIPSDIRSANSLGIFKEKIKFWTTDKCPCRLCKTYIGNVGFI